jgi:Amt family ammonium transporter
MRVRELRRRFVTGFSDPALRANALALAGGKAIGLTLLVTAMRLYLPQALHAQAAAGAPPPEIDAVNTAWTLLAAFLVFGMQVGFVMLEAGFARSRESINVLVEGIVNTCICGLVFWAWGFAFLFEPGYGFINEAGFFLKGLPETYMATGVPLLAFWLFQFALADTCAAITSGAMVGRCGFIGDIFCSIGVTGFIYPIIGHWAWCPVGWLAMMSTPFRDFAGSAAVHSIGGAISLVGAIALGPRVGRVFRRDGGGPPLPHNIILGAVGGVILWFGWYGFTAGSTFSAMDAQGIGRIAANTTLAASAAGLAALFYAHARVGTWDLGLTTSGFLAGLVAICCPCYWVSPVGALFIGLVAGIVVIWATDALEYFRVDDPIGIVPVHLVCGIWGTLSLGLFATGAYGVPTATGVDASAVVKGLFYGGGTAQFVAQAIGSGVIVGATLLASAALMYIVNATGTLRISREGDYEGIDLHEHGMVAYPEYVIHAYEPVPAKSRDV